MRELDNLPFDLFLLSNHILASISFCNTVKPVLSGHLQGISQS